MLRAVLVTALTAAALAGSYAVLIAPDAAAPPEGTSLAGLPAAELRDEAQLPASAAPAPQPQPSPAALPPPAVRNVTPPGITAGPVVTGALQRIAPPAPEPPPPPPARRELLFNPIVTAAGVIRVRGRDLSLAGIAAPDFEARCGKGAAAWPCGRMARAALRRFVRGRAIECQVPEGADDIPDPADCYVAGESLGAWLVIQGWAKNDGERFAKLAAKARDARLGLWGERRPGAQPEVAASSPASAPDRTLPISDRVSDTP